MRGLHPRRETPHPPSLRSGTLSHKGRGEACVRATHSHRFKFQTAARREAWLRDLAAHFRARFILNVAPSEIRGRRECRALDAPAASCVARTDTRVSHHVTPEITRHSPRNGFTAYFVLSPATSSFCHRRCRIGGWPNPVGPDLPPTAWHQQRVPERHDLAVRKKRRSSCAPHFAHEVHLALRLPFRAGRPRVHRIPCPTSVTIAKRPSCGHGTARISELICARREAKYFCKRGLTRFLKIRSDLPVGQNHGPVRRSTRHYSSVP
jgi:hypothetical protein